MLGTSNHSVPEMAIDIHQPENGYLLVERSALPLPKG